MVTTVTDNSPQSINTSLFSLDKEVQEVKKTTDALNDKLSGINTESGVISVNGKQGIVELNASDVDALPSSTVIPTTTSELENNSGFITINDVGSSFVPVTRKVNNKQLNTDITLTASDVGALPNTTVIPTKTSELTNNSGFITSSDSITGNAATATTADKATKDASGNVITSTYLPLSGGAMTGNISYQGSKSTDEMIKFIDNKNDAYGNGISIGGGGATIIGGGESSNVLKDTLTSGGNELMKIGNDDTVEIWTNLQDGIASGKKFTFGVDGNITTPLGTVALKSELENTFQDHLIGYIRNKPIYRKVILDSTGYNVSSADILLVDLISFNRKFIRSGGYVKYYNITDVNYRIYPINSKTCSVEIFDQDGYVYLESTNAIVGTNIDIYAWIDYMQS